MTTTIASPRKAKPPKGRSSRRFSALDRARLLRLYERSGHSAYRFCREHDLSTSLLWYWLARERASAEAARGAGALVEVPSVALPAPGRADTVVTMRLAGGTRLEVLAGADPAWIGELVRALTPAGA